MKITIIKDKKHWLKMFLILMVILGVGQLFISRYKIGLDFQQFKCIPGYKVYLIDTMDKRLTKGKTYAFNSERLEPIIKDGTILIKYLEGMPGDKIKIDDSEKIFVNQNQVGYGLAQAHLLSRKKEDFLGELVLKNDSYWLMGSSPLSFDSRYWGTVRNDQIIGRAYPIL